MSRLIVRLLHLHYSGAAAHPITLTPPQTQTCCNMTFLRLRFSQTNCRPLPAEDPYDLHFTPFYVNEVWHASLAPTPADFAPQGVGLATFYPILHPSPARELAYSPGAELCRCNWLACWNLPY